MWELHFLIIPVALGLAALVSTMPPQEPSSPTPSFFESIMVLGGCAASGWLFFIAYPFLVGVFASPSPLWDVGYVFAHAGIAQYVEGAIGLYVGMRLWPLICFAYALWRVAIYVL